MHLPKFYHQLLKMKLTLVTSDVENNDNDSSEILDLIDSAYKNIKYVKIKYILLQDIKNDVSEFIQNEIKTKIRHAQ